MEQEIGRLQIWSVFLFLGQSLSLCIDRRCKPLHFQSLIQTAPSPYAVLAQREHVRPWAPKPRIIVQGMRDAEQMTTKAATSFFISPGNPSNFIFPHRQNDLPVRTDLLKDWAQESLASFWISKSVCSFLESDSLKSPFAHSLPSLSSSCDTDRWGVHILIVQPAPAQYHLPASVRLGSRSSHSSVLHFLRHAWNLRVQVHLSCYLYNLPASYILILKTLYCYFCSWLTLPESFHTKSIILRVLHALLHLILKTLEATLHQLLLRHRCGFLSVHAYDMSYTLDSLLTTV